MLRFASVVSVTLGAALALATLHGRFGLAAAPRQAAATIPSDVLTVISKDGTRIAVECAGAGPTLLFVHGGVGDRTRWTPMFPLLASRFTTCAMDRRGRGGSGDATEYSLRQEAEDVVAVVESRPGQVYVFGHSYGGVAALEAALMTNRIRGLMLYEPPLHEPVDHNLAVAAKVEARVRSGDLEGAFIAFQTEVVKQSPEELARMKSRPNWARLVATIAVHPRQMRALAAYRFDAERIRTITVPTLLLLGGETPSTTARQSIEALKATLPHPTLVVLEGQEHNAMDGGRELIAKAIREFAAGRGGPPAAR
jgi:pimeloyl-ACP methyl ester carboxylesterase